MAVERLISRDNIVTLAQEMGVHRQLLYKGEINWSRWNMGEPAPSTPELRRQVRQLKRLPEEAMEVGFFTMPCTKSRLDPAE